MTAPPSHALTDQGIAVDLKYIDDCKVHDLTPFTLDVIEAYVDGEPAGYLQLSYLGQEAWDEDFSTVWEYVLSDEYSMYHDLAEIDSVPADERNTDYYRQAISQARRRISYEEHERMAQMNLQELSEQWEATQAGICKEALPSYLAFRSDNLNKPVIFYSRVYSASYNNRMIDGEKVHHPGPHFQEQGIGTVLYEAAAIWMHEKGMNIWAGMSQTPRAKATWEKLERKYNVTEVEVPYSTFDVRIRRYLDGSQVRLASADVAPSLSHLGAAPAEKEMRQEAYGPEIHGPIAEHLGWEC